MACRRLTAMINFGVVITSLFIIRMSWPAVSRHIVTRWVTQTCNRVVPSLSIAAITVAALTSYSWLSLVSEVYAPIEHLGRSYSYHGEPRAPLRLNYHQPDSPIISVCMSQASYSWRMKVLTVRSRVPAPISIRSSHLSDRTIDSPLSTTKNASTTNHLSIEWMWKSRTNW